MHATLGQVQAELGFASVGSKYSIMLDCPCGHIHHRRELFLMQVSIAPPILPPSSQSSSIRDCALDKSCVLCSCYFHYGPYKDHNISFFIVNSQVVAVTVVMLRPGIVIFNVFSTLSSI